MAPELTVDTELRSQLGPNVVHKPLVPSRLLANFCHLPCGPRLEMMPAAVPTPLAGGHVLVVEDQVLNQMVLTKMLERLGYSVDVASNGSEAVKKVFLATYDIVLMDCQMPGMNGLEATAEIRRREGPGRHTIIVGVTADAMKEAREACFASGMDDYLSKPFRPHQIDDTLRRWRLRAPPSVAPEPIPTVDALDALVNQLGERAAARIFSRFDREIPERLSQLRKAASHGDLETVAKLCHSLKGATGLVGALLMSGLCGEIHNAAKDGGGELPQLLQQLDQCYETTVTKMRGLVGLQAQQDRALLS
ncbi:MAG: response regulator [Myxococcales bacterium]